VGEWRPLLEIWGSLLCPCQPREGLRKSPQNAETASDHRLPILGQNLFRLSSTIVGFAPFALLRRPGQPRRISGLLGLSSRCQLFGNGATAKLGTTPRFYSRGSPSRRPPALASTAVFCLGSCSLQIGKIRPAWDQHLRVTASPPSSSSPRLPRSLGQDTTYGPRTRRGGRGKTVNYEPWRQSAAMSALVVLNKQGPSPTRPSRRRTPELPKS
jgi:hypothetical protein